MKSKSLWNDYNILLLLKGREVGGKAPPQPKSSTRFRALEALGLYMYMLSGAILTVGAFCQFFKNLFVRNTLDSDNSDT